jgi:hypothetical protein
MEFSPFYLAPVSFFSWFIGKRAGIALAVTSVVFSFLIRLSTLPGAIADWDALVWLALYLSSCLVIAQLKRLYVHERHVSRIDPLTESRTGVPSSNRQPGQKTFQVGFVCHSASRISIWTVSNS